ncbi:uncharacterized protein ASPGLDRAFT_125960, partial [Aspergillus glaucus CBS 516.65]
LINTALAIIAVILAYSKFDGREFTSAMLYEGNCSVSKNWERGLHLLINTLSTIMLAASNYCMQCLSSPSRQNVDTAHTQRRWLDIGVSSMKNLSFVGWRRCTLWVLLLISSLPIHLIYNSAVFSALGTNQYSVLHASANFDFNNPPNNDPDYANCFEQNVAMNISSFSSKMSEFDRLNTQECINTYAADFITDRGTLIIVTNNSTDNDWLRHVAIVNPLEEVNDPFEWMCENEHGGSCTKDDLANWSLKSRPWSAFLLNVTVFSNITYTFNVDAQNEIWDFASSPDEQEDLSNLFEFMKHWPPEEELRQHLNASHWKNSSWSRNIIIQEPNVVCPSKPDGWPINPLPDAFPVDYCLSQKIDERCQLLFSLPICFAVIFCNAIKVVCMFLTAHDDRKEIFLTVGDAISSFVNNPDRTTESRCLLSKSNIEKGPRPWSASLNDNDFPHGKPAARLPGKKRWMKAVSISYWTVTITLCLLILVFSSALLSLAIETGTSKPVTFRSLWNLGFGTATSSTIVRLCGSNNCGLINTILVANSPQIPVSIAYFLYNNLLTNMLLAAEYDDYARQRKPLRVSWPRGLQRSTYYLSLPYRYSIPLLASHALLHWLVSQSLFFVEVFPYNLTGILMPDYRLVACGHSPIAIIFTISLGFLMVCTIIGLGVGRFKSSIPLAASCSAAISAACHPPPGDDHAVKPVMWGESSRSRASSEDDEEATNGSESSPDTRSRQPDGEESRARSLTENNGPDEECFAGYGHCSFSSQEVITPDPLRLYT